MGVAVAPRSFRVLVQGRTNDPDATIRAGEARTSAMLLWFEALRLRPLHPINTGRRGIVGAHPGNISAPGPGIG